MGNQIDSNASRAIRVTCPFDMLVDRYLDKVIEHRLHLEIGLNGAILEHYSEGDFQWVSELLGSHDLSVTIHAPFTDLPLGSVNSRIREAAIYVLKQAINVSHIFKAPQMVIHTGFDPKHHGMPDASWATRLGDSINELMEYASTTSPGLVIAVENTFEHDPTLHEMLFSHNSWPCLGFCFDLAHQVVFSTSSMDTWLNGACGERLVELHLHDNRGEKDEHLAVGQGILDFEALFKWLKDHGKHPFMTIEAHDEGAVLPALKAVQTLVKKYLNSPCKSPSNQV